MLFRSRRQLSVENRLELALGALEDGDGRIGSKLSDKRGERGWLLKTHDYPTFQKRNTTSDG